MIVSLNEIESTCYRAGLGVGLPHGLAEDAAATASRLAQAGEDAAGMMLRGLRRAEGFSFATPVFTRRDSAWVAARPELPALVAGPMAADLEAAGHPVQLDGAVSDDEALLAAARGLLPQTARREAAGFAVSDADWRDLQALAARTYVKSSARSRLMGAGAGLRDSD